MSQLLARADRVELARAAPGKVIATVEALLANSGDGRTTDRPSLLAPNDLQAIKASGSDFEAGLSRLSPGLQLGKIQGCEIIVYCFRTPNLHNRAVFPQH
jgi:hypothetical protein